MSITLTQMTTSIRRTLAAVVVGTALVSMAACGSANTASGNAGNNPADSGTIEVVTSINQWGSVARALGGDLVNVTSIMTATNVEAHDYEPTSSDIARISRADVAVVNGADYDPWASKAAQGTHATLVDAAEAGGIREGDNPHVWFSSRVRERTADAITAAYKKAQPEHKAVFEKLNVAWHRKSNALETSIRDASAKLEGLPYAATESVAWYLADDLGMTDATPKGYATASANESEPGPADIRDFTDALASGSIRLLVVNTQEANSVTDHLTAAAKDANVPVIDITEQMPGKYANLLDWMNALVSEFAAAVR